MGRAVQAGGASALIGFSERFFVVAFHIASCALAGYGLARGWGWQFYLLASFLHAFMNYSVIALQTNLLSSLQMEIFIGVWAVLVAAGALWLRWSEKAPAEQAPDTGES